MRIPMLMLGLVFSLTAPTLAQTPTARAQTLASEFSKFKNETRIKKGTTRTKYKEVVSEAWVARPEAYAGRYFTDDGMRLDITVGASGQVTGSGRDDARFELRNLTISDGLLTGTKVYSDGSRRNFEAVFLKRATRESADAGFSVHYGIGMLVDESRVFAVRQ